MARYRLIKITPKGSSRWYYEVQEHSNLFGWDTYTLAYDEYVAILGIVPLCTREDTPYLECRTDNYTDALKLYNYLRIPFNDRTVIEELESEL